MIDKRYMNNIVDELNDYALQRGWWINPIKLTSNVIIKPSNVIIKPFAIWSSDPVLLSFRRDRCIPYIEQFEKRKFKTNSKLIASLDAIDVHYDLDNFIIEHIRVNFPKLVGETIRFLNFDSTFGNESFNDTVI